MMSIKPKVAVIIQARMNSSRLPGKVLMDIAGEPMIGWLVKRVKSAKQTHMIIVATSDGIKDDPLAMFCEKNKINCYRGSETNVLQRMIEAAQFYNAEVIVRLTADNPFVSADLVDQMVSKFLSLYPNIDYVSNTDNSGFPFGLFVEVVKTNSLLAVQKSLPSPDQIEHVTLSFRQCSSIYQTYQVKSDLSMENVMLTIDTKDDLNRLNSDFKSLVKKDPNFNYLDMAAFYGFVG